MKKILMSPVLIGYALALIGVIIFAIWLKWEGLLMNVAASGAANLLAPIAFAAAVVERGVEILISPWRDPGANKLEAELAAAKANPLITPRVPDITNRLNEYRGQTQRYAFAVSLPLSTIVSISGVRAIGPFLDKANFTSLAASHPGQHAFFLCVDVALSAILLAGGADGIHSLVNAITTFFDASAQKTTQANPPA